MSKFHEQEKKRGKRGGKEAIYSKLKVRARMKKKLLWIFIAFIAGLSVLTGVMLYIAVVHHEEYSKDVLDRLNYSSTTLLAERGKIYDSNMSVIAECEEKFIVIIEPSVINYSVKDREATIQAFCEFFGCDESYFTSLLDNEDYRDRNYLRYVAQENEGNTKKYVVDYNTKTAWEEYISKVNQENKQFNTALNQNGELSSQEKSEQKKGSVTGVWFESEYARTYPYNDSASKVIGFTSNDSSTGLWGLESYYNDILTGTNGRRYGYVNEYDSLEQEMILPTNGNSIVSTIDMNITSIVERAITRWHDELGMDGSSWSVLIMDPNNGEVKSMVTSTDYDLNNPTDISAFYSEEEIQNLAQENGVTEDEELTQLRNGIWRNFIISNTFEPGSTAKALTIASALEEGTVTMDSQFFCNGAKQVLNYLIKCHNYAQGGCGELDLAGALAESCNVSLMDIAEALGAEEFARYQEIFNLGQKTGIDLPGEASAEGLLYSASELGATELATSSFGQSYNVTMLQMAAAYCSLINGGNYYKPHVVSRILDEDGYVVSEVEPEIVRETVSRETSDSIKVCLEEVVENGTAADCKIEGYRIGGKTGTAEKVPRGNGKYVVSFISAAPIDNPQMLVYAVVDEPTLYEDSSYSALMIVRYVWEELLPYLGISKDETIQDSGDGTSVDDSWTDSGSFMEEISDDGQNVMDEQPVENPDAGEEQPAENQDTGEEQPAENPDTGEEQPAENQDAGEEQPAENPDAGEEQPAENQDTGEEQPAENQDTGEEQPAENQDTGEEQPAENQDTGEEQPVENPDAGEEQPVENQNSGEE